MFKDRLRKYREEELNLSTKREMAEKLGISEQLYAMVERGDRTPSNDFLRKLVVCSNIPEEYWLYGVQSENDLVAKRKTFKSIERTVLDLMEEGYITDINFSKEIEDILITAIKADIQHLLLKKSNNI